MHNFLPTFCKDNFFDEPDKIINLANEVSYEQVEVISGFRSTELQNIDKDLNKYINNKILKLVYPSFNFKTGNNVQFSARTYFQKSDADLNDGWVHIDGEALLTAIIYLTRNNTSGTSLFSFKKEYVRPDFDVGNIKYDYFKNKNKYSNKDKKKVFEKKLEHNNHFIKDVNFAGRFNRMVCFDSKQWHAAEVCDKERLVIVSFIGNLKQSDIK